MLLYYLANHFLTSIIQCLKRVQDAKEWYFIHVSLFIQILSNSFGSCWKKFNKNPVKSYEYLHTMVPSMWLPKGLKTILPNTFWANGHLTGKRGGVPTKGKRGEVVTILLSGNITHIHKLRKLLMTKSSKEDSELIRTV